MTNEKSERVVIICPYFQFQEYLKCEISKRISKPLLDIIERADSMFMDSLPHLDIEKHERSKQKPYFILNFNLLLVPYSQMAIDAGDEFCNSISKHTANPSQRNLDSVIQNSPWFVECDPEGVEIHSSLKSTGTKWPDTHLDVFPCCDYLNWANGGNNGSDYSFHTPNDELLLHFNLKNKFMNELLARGVYNIKTRDLLPNQVNVRPYIPNLENDINAIFNKRYGNLILFEKSEPIE